MGKSDGFVYVGGRVTQTVKKLQKSDLTKVAESGNYGGIINALAEDNDFVYVGGETTQTVKKLRKSDLVEVAECEGYGGFIFALVEDNSFVYVGGEEVQTVKKLQKSDLVEVAESGNYGGTIMALAEDEPLPPEEEEEAPPDVTSIIVGAIVSVLGTIAVVLADNAEIIGTLMVAGLVVGGIVKFGKKTVGGISGLVPRW